MNSFSLRSYDAILFDLDSTLTDTQMYPLRASEWMLAKCTPDADEMLSSYLRELVTNYFSEIEEIVKGGPYKTPYQVVKGATRTALEDLQISVNETMLEEGTQYFKNLHIELSRVMPGTLPLLSNLKSSGIPMGVITNSFEGHAHIILDELNLADFIGVIVDGGDVKAFKPMREIFDYALSELGVFAENSLCVGDEFYADIVGASLIGMDAVWINLRERSLADSLEKYGNDIAPVLVLSSIAELQDYL